MRLVIYEDRSVLEDGETSEIFLEGKQSINAKARIKQIKAAFQAGFLEDLIEQEQNTPSALDDISDFHRELMSDLVNSVTSEVGRALIGITVMQLAIKAICPEQNIRLHKGGAGQFSWKEGISMRTLDKSYITPVLRRFGLLSLNADGFMMTRSLAENYPYTKLYKAAIRGSRESWFKIVDEIDNGEIDANDGLRYFLSLLLNRASGFQQNADKCLELAKQFSDKNSGNIISEFIFDFASRSDYGARLFEIALHSIFQVLEEDGVLEGSLKPLSQMRSANKKHGNIGDVEVLLRAGSPVILEAWDAKFGKADLREEIEELSEKLIDHRDCVLAGFVCDQEPIINDSMQKRIDELEALHEVEILISNASNFIDDVVVGRVTEFEEFRKKWLMAFVESICQKRRDKAPIDEPCNSWVDELIAAL
ncbi:MAG: hypothetical protein H8E32_00525 [Nitrospinae bacterium]|nr:hypothetical protein [Nitrospinota bacterium]